MINAITVDVEDYFHTECMSPYAPREQWNTFPSRVVQNTEALYALFSNYGVRGTFYFLGWVAERYPSLVQRAVALGHEVGCHSYAHHPVFRLNPDEFYRDTSLAKQIIEDAAGVAVTAYRAPNFSITPRCSWAFDILAELGFVTDSSVNPVRHPLYGNPTASREPWITHSGIIEYPIATWRVLGNNLPTGGGAYLRILPYQLVKNGVRAMNRQGLPAVVYLHPWEIDADQPRLPAHRTARLRQYLGLSAMEQKLSRLMTDFQMSTLSEAYSLPEIPPLALQEKRAV